MMFQRKVVSNKRKSYGMLNRIFNGCLGAFLMAGCAQEVTDSGVQAVQEAQESKKPEASTQFSAQTVQEAQESKKTEASKQFSAVKKLNQLCMEKKWNTQWDEEKKRRFIIVTADFKSMDPAKYEDFVQKREDAMA